MAKAILLPIEQEAMKITCPYCGARKGKKCKIMAARRMVAPLTEGVQPSGKLSARPHQARVNAARKHLGRNHKLVDSRLVD